MDNTPKPEEAHSSVSIPTGGYPVQVYDSIQKALKAKPQRSLAFQNRSDRSTAFIQKGLAKPGKISYDVLRQTSLAVHVVRICIHTLTQKVTKTKWVVQNKDVTKRKSGSTDKRIEEVTNLFKHPNKNNDTFRTLLDKILEDLLVLDAVSIEKTRYPDGRVAELFYVDSATIRPVFDEFGNQDVIIPLNTIEAANRGESAEELPVSYVQVLDNSQYGGPESGEIVGAWPKKDMLHFHMNPQGAMESFGYGLSPIEGILSVVANLLNADNYNSTYFEEGAFPPIILQLIGQVNQRDLEAYREYMVSELQGNFHRPAIMATEKADSLQVHNLKDMTNRDMQFMEYQDWLAKLVCAMYGMSPQDIGITDNVGSKNVAEEQTELSENKGYTSILSLLKEVFNQEIVWKDFGYEDLEFDWVATDQMSPQEQSTMYDRDLRNGSMTLNEVRAKRGEPPFPEWADKPMLLTTEGFKPLDPEEKKKEMEQQPDMVGGEKPYNEQDNDDIDATDMEKSQKTLYVSRPILNAMEVIDWAKSNGFTTTLPANDMHVTIAYSKKALDWERFIPKTSTVTVEGGIRNIKQLGNMGAIVLRFESDKLKQRWAEFRDGGASWDYAEYLPHITISYDGEGVDLASLKPYNGSLVLGPENWDRVQDDWKAGITEKALRKGVFTANGYKTWADDRGYSQPFIYMDVKSGFGTVIKPPVAVNLQSQELEIDLTAALAEMGLNVNPVRKMTFVEVTDMLRATPELYEQFMGYVNMTDAYDSEKWRSKLGGSRKFPYYLVSDYTDGYSLANKLLIEDMKRDPDSYAAAVRDLARLWKVERDLMLGDRRADQYIIGADKRAYGIDYQFKGDKGRWERSKNAIRDSLSPIPSLLKVFNAEVENEGLVRSLMKRLRGRL